MKRKTMGNTQSLLPAYTFNISYVHCVICRSFVKFHTTIPFLTSSVTYPSSFRKVISVNWWEITWRTIGRHKIFLQVKETKASRYYTRLSGLWSEGWMSYPRVYPLRVEVRLLIVRCRKRAFLPVITSPTAIIYHIVSYITSVQYAARMYRLKTAINHQFPQFVHAS